MRGKKMAGQRVRVTGRIGFSARAIQWRRASDRLMRCDPRAGEVVTQVAAAYRVSPDLLLHRSRCRAEVAMARQIAMYLVHVLLSRSLLEVGTMFRRDRTTVAHACAMVEDRRDDKTFDELLLAIELRVTPHQQEASGHAAA